ncbi:hypothetical protein D3C73_1192290 [compost metagenome]
MFKDGIELADVKLQMMIMLQPPVDFIQCVLSVKVTGSLYNRILVRLLGFYVAVVGNASYTVYIFHCFIIK